MKKIISAFLLFHFIFVYQIKAYSYVTPAQTRIVYENNKYCLKDSNTNQTLIPCLYDSMKQLNEKAVKVSKNGKYGVLYNNNQIIIPIEYDKIKTKNVKQNDETYTNYYGIDNKTGVIISKLEVGSAVAQGNSRVPLIQIDENNNKNYPTNYIIAVPESNLRFSKVGFVRELGNNTYITIPAIYDDYYFPDGKSLISQEYDISYFTNAIIVKKNGKWGIIDKNGNQLVDFVYDKIITFDPVIDENVINRKPVYSEISFPVKDKFIAFSGNNVYVIDLYGKILYSGSKPTIQYNLNSKNFLEDIYNKNNLKSFIKFENFPQKGVIPYQENLKKGLIVIDETGVEKLPAYYDDFYFPDSNSVIFNLLNISYAPLTQIWGMDVLKGKYFVITDKNNYKELRNKIPDENLSENYLSFENRIIPTVTTKNTVTMRNSYIQIFNNNMKTPYIDFKNYKIEGKVSYNQKRALSEVAIKSTGNNLEEPMIQTVNSLSSSQAKSVSSQKTNGTQIQNATTTTAKTSASTTNTNTRSKKDNTKAGLGWVAVVLLAPLELIALPFVALFFWMAAEGYL